MLLTCSFKKIIIYSAKILFLNLYCLQHIFIRTVKGCYNACFVHHKFLINNNLSNSMYKDQVKKYNKINNNDCRQASSS